jgi:hypothetical protein
VSHRRGEWDFFRIKVSKINAEFREWCRGGNQIGLVKYCFNEVFLHIMTAIPTVIPTKCRYAAVRRWNGLGKLKMRPSRASGLPDKNPRGFSPSAQLTRAQFGEETPSPLPPSPKLLQNESRRGRRNASVLAAVKDKPFGRPQGAVLDCGCARRLVTSAGAAISPPRQFWKPAQGVHACRCAERPTS